MEQLKLKIEKLIEREKNSLDFTPNAYSLPQDTAGVRGKIVGYQQGLIAIQKIKNKESYKDMLEEIDTTLEDYKIEEQKAWEEKRNAKSSEFGLEANITFYIGAILALKECKKNIKILKIEKESQESQRLAVTSYVRALNFIENQTPELCLLAVKSNGLALEFVKNKTELLCYEAVKENPMALEFTNIQTPKIINKALSQDKNAEKFLL